MATDPEARASGSSAAIIAVVALILIVGLAFVMMNRGGDAPIGDTTVVNTPPSTVVNPPDVKVEAPDVTVAPDTSKSGSTTTTTTTNSSGGS